MSIHMNIIQENRVSRISTHQSSAICTHNTIRIIYHSNYTITNYEREEHRVSIESSMNIVKACVQAFNPYLTLKFYVNTRRVMLTSFLDLSFIIKMLSSLVFYYLRLLFKFS